MDWTGVVSGLHNLCIKVLNKGHTYLSSMRSISYLILVKHVQTFKGVNRVNLVIRIMLRGSSSPVRSYMSLWIGINGPLFTKKRCNKTNTRVCLHYVVTYCIHNKHYEIQHYTLHQNAHLTLSICMTKQILLYTTTIHIPETSCNANQTISHHPTHPHQKHTTPRWKKQRL